jgi:hypothetical protein
MMDRASAQLAVQKAVHEHVEVLAKVAISGGVMQSDMSHFAKGMRHLRLFEQKISDTLDEVFGEATK